METNEMMNEGVIETAEEFVKGNSGKGIKVAAGIGIVVLAGVLAYKYVAKPMIAKIKSKKEIQIVQTKAVSENDVDDSEEPIEA